MLARQCRSSFDPMMLSRGMDYFRSGRVISCSREGKVFQLKVRGIDGIYEIFLDFQKAFREQKIEAQCNCSYYLKGNLCKHLWAALLRIDSERVPELFPQEQPLLVKHLHRGEEDSLESSEDESEELEEFDEAIDPFSEKPSGSQQYSAAPWPKTWKDRINQVQKGRAPDAPQNSVKTRKGAKIAYYGIGIPGRTDSAQSLVIELFSREILGSGNLGKLKPWKVSALDLETHSQRIALDEDQELISWLLKIGKPAGGQAAAYRGYGYYTGISKIAVDPAFHIVLIPRIAASGRLIRDRDPEIQTILRDDSSLPWDVQVKVENENQSYVIRPHLVRGGEVRSVTRVKQAFASGYLFFEDSFGRLSRPELYSWILAFRDEGEAQVPPAEAGSLIEMLLNDPHAPQVFWPSELQWTEQKLDPRVRAVFSPSQDQRMLVEVSFEYPGLSVGWRATGQTGRIKVDSKKKSVYSRNEEFEAQARVELERILNEIRQSPSPLVDRIILERNEFSPLASRLISAGWEVLAQGKALRVSQKWEMTVSSGVNWFDLNGKMDFDGKFAEFHELLKAIKRGQGWVELGDGSVGILPTEWLARYASLAQMGQVEKNSLRFQKVQGLFLDAWLSGEQHVRLDEEFRLFQNKVRQFEGIPKKNAPSGFQGKLRPYQKEGLAWFGFAEEFGIGGILADDMGLGKTIQFLAFLLDYLKRNSKSQGPSLVVAPKSLVFNWMEESARFAPQLKVLNYTGKDRAQVYDQIDHVDLVLTTYPVIRADIELIKKIPFRLAVVDEAQAIKNPKSQVAQACKVIQAKHRFAMTGTPIENSLEDLFSILDFTSPGFLDFPSLQDFGDESRGRLAQALKPVILRRTKAKVLRDLPEKTEQTVYCQMSAAEERRYDELRTHYRATLLEKISDEGLGRSKLHVLEALLRLRQASCHPGLIDPTKKMETSAKLEHLIDQLREVISEGHKALVFSQFTSMLGIVQTHLRKEGIRFEYLDGKTEDRQERVQRFQTDPECPVFLISLKAGGTGLNLTAASYVYLLDPWWNPAVEAQAIDRAHRIGQARKVFAYRMIARGTVEEKILELQKSKRELADAIISEDGGFLRKMTREDLELLLS